MANSFITVNFDKFENKQESSMTYDYKLEKISNFSYGYKASLRHVKMPNVDQVVIDITIKDNDWVHLRDGRLTIRINDSENIVLEPTESYSKIDSLSSAQWCEESDWYPIDREALKDICDAKSLEFKLTGGNLDKVYNGDGFITYARQFYNGVFDQNAYKDSLNTKAKSTGGCLVTILMAIGLLLSLVI